MTFTNTNHRVLCICFYLLLFLTVSISSQAQTLAMAADGIYAAGIIKGQVKTNDNSPVGYVSVMLKGTTKGGITDEDGNFQIKNVKEGTYTLIATYVGLEAQEKEVIVTGGQTVELELELPRSSQQLSEVVITDTRTVNKKPVSIGKIAINPLDMPQSMAIVSSRIIADQQASKLSDVIKNVNGVSLGTTRGSTAETFFARGYNLGANNIFKNGARSNSAVIPEASTLERVEVLKGSAALLYGNVSGGAVINMVTKQPKFEYGGEVSMRAGSFNLYKPIADVYGPITKNLAFRAIGTYESAESFRNGVESKRLYVNPSLLYKIGARTDILLQGDYLSSDATPDFGIGTLGYKDATGKDVAGGKSIPTTLSRSTTFITPWAYNEVNQRNINLNVNHKLNNTWKLNLLASQQVFDRDYFSPERIQAFENGDWSRNLTRSKIKEDYYTGQINLTGTAKTGKIGHTILIGTDAEQYLNTTHAFNLTTAYDKINILDPTKYVPRTDEPEASLRTRTESPTYRFGTYAQDLISLSHKFKVLAGLRWSYQKLAVAKIYDFEKETTTNSTTATTRYDRAFSPRVGIVYQPVQNTSLFASYSNNFTPNTGKDIYEQNLEASIIDQYEIGVKNDLIKDKLSANLTYYKIINNNLAQQAQFLADGVTINTDANIKEMTGQTTSDGAELDLNGTLSPGLNFIAGYSYNFMRYTKTSGKNNSYIEGERLVSNPAHTANATIFYTLQETALKGLKVGASGFYTGERNVGWNTQVVINPTTQARSLNDRIFSIGGYSTFDVSLGYDYKKLSLLGKLSNITNTLNYLVHENYSVNPIAPRQFVTTLSYRF